ncbi:adenylate/guanylate cyclase domain-containing protein, partial [Rhizobium ruizarguesonis]
LMIPLLLLDHVIGTRIAHEFYGYIYNYETVVGMLWIRNPANGARQALVVVAVWIHGCIGIHFWLRYRSWYPDFSPLLLALAILVPLLSLLGFVEM